MMHHHTADAAAYRRAISFSRDVRDIGYCSGAERGRPLTHPMLEGRVTCGGKAR